MVVAGVGSRSWFESRLGEPGYGVLVNAELVLPVSVVGGCRGSGGKIVYVLHSAFFVVCIDGSFVLVYFLPKGG